MARSRQLTRGAVCAAILCVISVVPAEAQVVALGASNTEGWPAGSSLAYPAQLEAMLRASGRNVRVYNAGIYGDTTTGMLSRVDSAVPPGTKVVILQAGTNDYRRGVSPAQRAANIAAIQNRLRARGIKTVMAQPTVSAAVRQYPHPDRIHMTPAGHRLVAQRLLPQVLAGLR